MTFPFRSVPLKRNARSAFAVLSPTYTRPAYFRSVSVPFCSGPVRPLARLRKPRSWLGSIEGPLIDRSVKRSRVRSPTCQAVYRWRLLRVVDRTVHC